MFFFMSLEWETRTSWKRVARNRNRNRNRVEAEASSNDVMVHEKSMSAALCCAVLRCAVVPHRWQTESRP